MPIHSVGLTVCIHRALMRLFALVLLAAACRCALRQYAAETSAPGEGADWFDGLPPSSPASVLSDCFFCFRSV